MGRMEGKVALVTGGARGMGTAEARLLAKEGASVAVADILEDQGRSVAEDISTAGGRSLFLALDVSREEDWRRGVDAVVSAYGGLDVLVNNAGIGQQVSIEETSGELWDRVMAVNATGVFLGTKHAIGPMRRAGGGSIINISSLAGLLGGGTSAAYHASKGAVRLFTKSAAIQYGQYGIRVNSVHPGVIETPMNQEFLNDPANRRNSVSKTPLGRIGTPEDVAYAVLYLASDDSSFVTGAELVVDGGRAAE